ncbi:hypothetical protein KI810_08330 [Geobacter luticola]|uniref:Uncharacterized protein n=2 Tax=Geomobilimonas luticola TaxID=1114878 RepID=A0ABS5SCG4_9BACT|nr:hypothetical protein [Geomobilimonas luticola]
MPLVTFCLAAGSIMHVAGLMVYDRFPYLYLFSALLLSLGYYLFLKGKQYQPYSMASFWGMVVVLAIPIVGVIAGFQKMMVTPAKGRTPDKSDRRRTTLVTLLLAVPIAVFVAAMIMPAFPGAAPITMKIILVVAGVAELALLIALFTIKKRATASIATNGHELP